MSTPKKDTDDKKDESGAAATQETLDKNATQQETTGATGTGTQEDLKKAPETPKPAKPSGTSS